MRVAQLSLRDFRNYRHAEIVLDDGPHLFVGPNGQGKTNLVESVGYLSTLSSHRVSSDQALIRHGTDSALIHARLHHADRDVAVDLELNRSGPNRARISGSPAKPRDLARYVASVLFAPEDLALIRGEPGVRRRFVDQMIAARLPRLGGVMNDYERVLRQRNTLLKSARASGVGPGRLGTLDIWDERLVELGAQIIDARISLLAALRTPVREAYAAIAGADHNPELENRSSVDGPVEMFDDDTAGPEPGDAKRPSASEDPADEGDARSGRPDTLSRFRDAVAGARPRELERGVTLVGPHRDDVRFGLRELPAKGYASHGESWSFALALRLACAELLRAESAAGDPVLVLDDVFAELDQHRRARLAEAIAGYEQVLITSAVLDDIPEVLRRRTVQIRAGEIVDG